MSCHRFNINGCPGIICLADFYCFGGFTFQWHNYLGPCKVNHDLEPSKRTGRAFYKMIDKWVKLTKKQREKYRI